MNPVGSVGLNVGIFLLFVLLTLYVVYRASRTNRTASDYYAAGRAFTGVTDDFEGSRFEADPLVFGEGAGG